jgi:hypothetical protein
MNFASVAQPSLGYLHILRRACIRLIRSSRHCRTVLRELQTTSVQGIHCNTIQTVVTTKEQNEFPAAWNYESLMADGE